MREPFNPPPRREQPDLEEVLQQVGKKWQDFKPGSLWVILVLGALALFWSCWFTVQPEETGIVQRFGQVVRTATPGLHFKWPHGIETVRLVPTARVLKEEFGFRTLAAPAGERTQSASNQAHKGESLMLSGDLNVIDVQWIIQYRIEDPIRYLFQVRDTRKTNRRPVSI